MTAVSIPQASKLAALVKTGRANKGIRGLLYSQEKFGKTTFVGRAPAPLIIGPEDGLPAEFMTTPHIEPESWAQFVDVLHMLAEGGHAYRNIAIDTVDWMEPKCWAHVCAANGWASIEAPGYGRGYAEALGEWRKMLAVCDRIREHGVNVWLLAHATVKQFKNPDGEDYDRYALAMNQKAADMLKQWVDAVIFGNWRTLVSVDDKTNKAKAVGGKARVLYTTRAAAYDAGNRLGLPDSLALDWLEFERALSGESVKDRAAKLVIQLKDALDQCGDEDVKKKTLAWIPSVASDPTKLSEALNKLTAKMIEKKENSQ